jgi:hypothetical protein
MRINAMELGIYKHYKGNLYQVIGVACHTETGDQFIVYQALWGDYRLWVRPKTMFCEKVFYNNQQVDRFTLVCNPLKTAPTI